MTLNVTLTDTRSQREFDEKITTSRDRHLKFRSQAYRVLHFRSFSKFSWIFAAENSAAEDLSKHKSYTALLN